MNTERSSTSNEVCPSEIAWASKYFLDKPSEPAKQNKLLLLYQTPSFAGQSKTVSGKSTKHALRFYKKPDILFSTCALGSHYPSWVSFFKKKKDSRSTALSYRKKKHSYITCRNEHPPHKNKCTRQNTQHHHFLREEPTEANRLHRCSQRCATPKGAACCKPERQPELLHHGVTVLMPHTRTSITQLV